MSSSSEKALRIPKGDRTKFTTLVVELRIAESVLPKEVLSARSASTSTKKSVFTLNKSEFISQNLLLTVNIM